jgi:hypothetical protein
MRIRKRLPSIILNETEYDELSLVLADSYTRIYRDVLGRKMKLLLIIAASLAITLGSGGAAVAFYRQ